MDSMLTDPICCSGLENPTGIETYIQIPEILYRNRCCSGLENPTGIETMCELLESRTISNVAADLKTRQGLKQ